MKLTTHTKPLHLGLINALVGGLLTLSLTACGPHSGITAEADTLDTDFLENFADPSLAFTPEEIAKANFQIIKEKIFVPHCLNCHARDVQRGGVNLEDYASAFQLRQEIRSEVGADRMPRRAPPLSPELKELLFAWIDRDAPEL